MCVYIYIDFIRMDKLTKDKYITDLLSDSYPGNMEIYSSLFFVLQLVYVSFSLYDIIKFKTRVRNSLSSAGQTKVNFLEYFIYIIWILTVLTLVLYETIPLIIVEYIILPIVMLILILFILYYSFNFNAIFTQQSYQLLINNTAYIKEINQEISTNKTLAIDLSPDIISRVKIGIEDPKVYSNPNLNLKFLSDSLNIPMHVISKVINHHLGTNFYDLIHQVRVEHAMELLRTKSNQFTMEGIALEVGFNSRTSFYRAFKKITNQTPSGYLKTIKIND